MSLLGSIGGVLKGAVTGFIGSGGSPFAAGVGAVAGAKGKNKNKRANAAAANNQAAYRGVATPTLARSLVGLPGSNVYSASPVVAGGGFNGGGASGSWGSPATYASLANGAVVRVKKDGTPYKRYRSMNPMNPRAARRAIRRIKGARKMLQQIERQLPKQRVHSRPQRERVRAYR